MNLNSAPSSQFYVTGGTMDPDSASYIVRRADTELLDALCRRELCYVLASRQMGKSSLMASTARRLADDGILCAIVDLNTFSEQNSAADDWYYALVDHIANKLGLSLNVGAWWRDNWGLPPLGRLTTFLDRVVLAGVPGQIVIFVDEIDSTIRLPFSDDFFAAIRACYNARPIEPRFKQLTFVLLGVATPAQLIRDPTRTPFNVGRGVELSDFTAAEAGPLAVGLHPDPARASELLHRVLYWTDGHPYLTQTLCSYVVRNKTWEIDELVRDVFFSRRAAREEPNLRLVRERLTQGETDLVSVLNLYKEILAGRPVRDEPNSPVHASLRLSGIAKTDGTGELRVRNRIYQSVFSEEWVASEVPAEPSAKASVSPAIADAYATFDVLRKLPEFRSIASDVLARFFESNGLRGEALLVRVQGLQERDNRVDRRLIANLIDFDYPDLLLSFVHEGPITSAVLSPDGTTVFLGTRNGVARLWSSVSGRPVLPPFSHRGPVNAVAYSPDGKWLASGSDDHNAYIWNAKTGERSDPLRHQARVRFVAFSADSAKLISTSADGSAGIWDVSTAKPACSPLYHKDTVRMAAFSPDGTVAVTASYDRIAILWDLRADGPVDRPLLHEDGVTFVEFHPSGNTLLTGSEDGKVHEWDVSSKKEVRTLNVGGAAQCVAFSPDGHSIVCGSADGTATIWRRDSAESPCATLRHNDAVLSVGFTPDGQTILTGSADRSMRAWNALDGRPLGSPFRHYGSVTSVCSTPDAQKVLTTDKDGAARLWRLSPRAHASPPSIVHPANIKAAAFSDDGKLIGTACEDNFVRLWTVQGELAVPPLIHRAAVEAVAFAPDGKMIATGCEDGSVFLWDLVSARSPCSQFKQKAAVRTLRFSPDGTRLAIGNDDRTVVVLEVATARTTALLQLRGRPRTFAFSADGTQILTGDFNRSTRMWSLVTGEPVKSALEHSSVVSAVGFRPGDCDLLLSAAGKSVQLWRLKKDNEGDLRPEIAFSLPLADIVEHAEFTPRGDHLLVLTRSWAYCYALQRSGLVHIWSRLLRGQWIGTIHWRQEPDMLDLCQLDTGNSLTIESLLLNRPEVKPVAGTCQQLVSEWQWRLGLHVTPDYRLFPSFSTE